MGSLLQHGGSLVVAYGIFSFWYVGSLLWPMGSLLWHVGSFVAASGSFSHGMWDLCSACGSLVGAYGIFFSCGMQDLLVWHVGSLLLHVDSISSSMLDLLLVACGIFNCTMWDCCCSMWGSFKCSRQALRFVMWDLCCSMRDLLVLVLGS